MFYRPLQFQLSKHQANQAAENLNLARREAWRFHRRCDGKLAYDDLEAVAFLGLMKACHKFDASRGWKFSTYAVPKIRGELLHFVRDHSYLLRLSHRMRENWVKGRKLLDRGSNDQTVADSLGIELAEWLDTRSACSGAPLELKDSVADKNQLQAKEDDRLSRLELSIDKAWGRLDEAQAKNLSAHFKFDHLLKNHAATTLVAISECLYHGRDITWVQFSETSKTFAAVSVETGPEGELMIHTKESNA
jgi:RNA polymerase sigma factor (sigma-70 family)